MKELLEAVYDILANDPPLQSLLKGSEGDRRIYIFHPNLDIVINSEHPAYITYHSVSYSNKEAKSEVELPDEVCIFNIWGLRRDLLLEIFARIDELLNEIEIETQNYKVLRCVRDYKSDKFNERWNVPELEVKYRLSHIIKKDSCSYKLKVGSNEVIINQFETNPKEIIHSKNIRTIETSGGLIYATKVGLDKKIRKIKLNYIPESLKEELQNFYKNICQGSLKTIEFTDSDNQVYNAKWIDENFNFSSPFKNYWSGEINLRILPE